MRGLLVPVETDEKFLASEIEFFLSENRACPAGVDETGNLPAS